MVCEVLAPREYVSPRQRILTPREVETRNVAYELKDPRSYGVVVAAIEMAPFATPADVLVPVPDRYGSTRANRQLAKQISRQSGAPVCDALTRRLVVKSSRELRMAGLSPLSVAAHRMLQVHGCPPGRVLFVDNVVTTGGTALAAAEALGVPCAVLAWAWHSTHANGVDSRRPSVNPTRATHGWHCIGHAQSVPQMQGPWDDTDYLELCVGLSYRDFTTNAVLDLLDSWPDITKAEAEKRLRDGDSSWAAYIWDPMISHWYTVVEKGTTEETEHFRDRDQALRRLELIARDMADSRVTRLPQWRKEDVAAYLHWFKAQIPNRVDYVRLLWANDPNGSYDGLLADPVREAEGVFEEVFEENLANNPWRDRLPGGLADRMTPADFDAKALAEGTRVELEHTSDPNLATEIAMDHLMEDPAYYDKLPLIHANPQDLRQAIRGAAQRWEDVVVEEDEDFFYATIELKCPMEDELAEGDVLAWLTKILNALATTPTAQLGFKGAAFRRYKPDPLRVDAEVDVYDEEVTITLTLDPDDEATRQLVWALSDLDVDKLQKRLTKVCKENKGRGLKAERGKLAERYGRTPGAPRPKPSGPSPAEIVREEKKQARKVAAELEKNRKAKKGRYTFGPRTPTHNGASYQLLYAGKPVGVTFYEDRRGERRIASFNKLSWAGPRPADALSADAVLFHDKTFPSGTPAHAALPEMVEKVEAIKKWRAAQKKPPTKKAPKPQKAARKKTKRKPKKGAKKKAPARKAARKKTKRKPKKGAKKKAPARKAAKRTPARRAAGPEQDVDIIALARRARSENPLLAW